MIDGENSILRIRFDFMHCGIQEVGHIKQCRK